MLVYTARAILPVASPPIQEGAVAVDGGLIAEVGPKSAVIKSAGKDAELRDLGDVVVMPGVINAHTHLEMCWMAADPPDLGDHPVWLKQVMERRGAADQESARTAAEEQLRAMAGRGTVAVGDIAVESWIAPLIAQTSLHAVVFLEIAGMDSGRAEELLAEAAERLETISGDPHLQEAAARVRLSLTPQAPHTTSVPLLRALAGRSRASGEPLSLHVAESEGEMTLLSSGAGPLADLFRETGLIGSDWEHPKRTPVDHLHRLGVLTPRTLAVHCVHLGQQDHSMLQAGGVTVVTCPRSNRRLGVGKAPIPKLMREGIPVALGTGSLASVPDLDLFAEMAALLEEHDSLSPAAVLRMATLNGARALGLADRLGTIEEGKLAELVVVPLPEPEVPPLEVVCSVPSTVHALEDAAWEPPE
jgi:cytosine/adenosine deaminase-related metal-dependent hydrolase